MSKANPRIFSIFLAAISLALSAHAQATQYADAPPIPLGAAWYPEQWPESQWEPDLARMEAAHIHLVRVGEFAWSTMEPHEGDWRWEWLDRAITAEARHHIVVVLGTPTPTPPAWLTQAYPQTLRISNTGVRDEHGNRQQFSLADEKYRELARDVATRMAKRNGHNPDVVGWQIDNGTQRTGTKRHFPCIAIYFLSPTLLSTNVPSCVPGRCGLGAGTGLFEHLSSYLVICHMDSSLDSNYLKHL